MNVQGEEGLKKIPPHHKQLELCTTRPAYRQGRKLTAVKVYTVASESQHLYVYGVPSINLRTELKNVFNKYGEIIAIHVVPLQDLELFTECYHVHYKRIQSARIAKRLVDNKSFYGGVLHVCYAPEHETLEETEAKLLQRKKYVLTRLKKYNAATNETEKPNLNDSGDMVMKAIPKVNTPKRDMPSIYSEDDPILSLKKKQKKDTQVSISKYASQSSDFNGEMNDKRSHSMGDYTKKFVPLPLRNKCSSETPVYGPQLPKKNYDNGSDGMDKTEIFSKEDLQGSSKVNQNNIRKIVNVEKRIVFRNKIQGKLS